MTPSGAVSAGFNKAIASPGAALDFAKGNLGNLAYAAAPIMAGAMAVIKVVSVLAEASVDGELTSDEIKEAFSGKKK